MKRYIVLYNPYSGNYRGEILAKEVREEMPEYTYEYISMPEIINFQDFFNQYKEDDIIICGGDGTLNYFINKTANINYDNAIYYFSTGTGNDFYNDIGIKDDKPYQINKYIENLPFVIVNNKKYYFLNNVAFGLDGYCTEYGDKLKKKVQKPVNYTKIGLRGILFDYKPRNVTIEIDGKKINYKKVWIATTMHGRMYGGGMIMAPNQKRNNKEKLVTLVIVHDISRLGLLLLFPSIFKGTHIKRKKKIDVITGHNIKVIYDIPAPLQIDGETFSNITEYSVTSK